MKYRILHYQAPDELDALAAFLRWQAPGQFEAVETPNVLRHTRGKPGLMLFVIKPCANPDCSGHPKLAAVGYFNAVKWFQKEGRILC